MIANTCCAAEPFKWNRAYSHRKGPTYTQKKPYLHQTDAVLQSCSIEIQDPFARIMQRYG